MQSYGGRDQAIGFYYERLLNAGAVDEEFQLYGCMYLEQGEPGFYVTGKAVKMSAFRLERAQRGAYCTPVILQSYRAKVARGERQKLKRQFQFDVLKKLEEMYRTEFFQLIEKLYALPASDEAWPDFLKWKAALDGTFDADVLHLYKETVSMVTQMKLLTVSKEQQLIQWVETVEQQLMENEQQEEGEPHIFAGLAWLNEKDEIQYQQYGKQDMAWEKRQKLILQGNLVSPVFTKKLYYTATDFRVIQEKRQEFKQCMHTILGKDYFDFLRALYALPSVVPERIYRQMLQTAEIICNADEKTAFQLYGAQLRML